MISSTADLLEGCSGYSSLFFGFSGAQENRSEMKAMAKKYFIVYSLG
jgi:hypothetical protein